MRLDCLPATPTNAREGGEDARISSRKLLQPLEVLVNGLDAALADKGHDLRGDVGERNGVDDA